MKRVILLIWCGLSGLGVPVKAQVNEHSVRLLPLMHGEGLSSNRVTSIVQDRQGYLWFATEDGLNRYNGQEIKVFRHVPGDSTSLSSNTISRMLVDRRGMLWVAAKGTGLNCYNPVTGKFKAYRPTPGAPHGLPTDQVHYLLESRRGDIWIGADHGGGLLRFDPRRETFRSYLLRPDTVRSVENRRYNAVLHLVEDCDQVLWLGTRDGLYSFDPRTEKFTQYLDRPGSKDAYYENLVISMHAEGDDTLWLGYWGGGLKCFDKRTKRYLNTYRYVPGKALSGYANLVPAILPKSASELWVSTHDNGLAVFNKRSGRFDFIHEDPSDPHQVYSLQTSYLYQDRSGIIWVGSFDGVRYINPWAKAFQSVRLPAAGVPYGRRVAAAYAHGNRLYAGALGGAGLYVYDRQDASWRTFPVTPGPHDIRDILRDPSGQWWVSTSAGVFGFDTLTHRFGRVFPPPGAPAAYRTVHFTCLLADRAGNLWMGTEVNGLFKYNPQDQSFAHYRPLPDQPRSLAGFAVQALLEDRRGTVWAATSAGLSGYHPAGDDFTNFTHNPRDENSLPAAQVSGLAEDNAGNLWAGTLGGLCRLSGLPTGKPTFTVYTVADGLPTNTVYGLTRDGAGRIWMGTAKGLSCVDPRPATPRFGHFDKRDGLVQDYPNAELTTTATGHILIGFAGSVTSFHPDSLLAGGLLPGRAAPPVSVYSLKIFDQEATLDSTLESKTRVQLRYDENFFTIGFSALQYINPERNQYRYKLDGYDHRWNLAGNRGLATYTKVPPGSYRFRVMALGHYGGAAPEQTLRIVILPPWWRTWWAYAGYGGLAAAALLLARREVVKRERLRGDLRIKQVESEKWQELDTLKSRFFTNISHEFRTPLTLIAGTVDDLLGEDTRGSDCRPQHVLIQRNARRLLQLINQLLDLSKLEAGRLHPDARPGSLTAFLQTTVQGFAYLAASRDIGYVTHLPDRDYRARFDRDKLEKILNNLLSNALKFTPGGGTVRVTAAVEPLPAREAYQLAVTVSDNGIGIGPGQLPHIFDRFYQGDNSLTRSYEGSGVGLALAKELTELQGGTLSAASTPGQGTAFRLVLTLPVAGEAEPSPAEPAAPGPAAGPVAPETPWPAASLTDAPPAAGPDPLAEPGEGQTKVLVVEDDPDLRRYIVKHLSGQCVVLEAENGATGWRLAHQQLPDLVITDVMMPGVDGLTLCKRLKKHPHTAHIPVVLLTAKARHEDRIEGLELGANDYLTKPFDARELLLRVQNQLATQKQQREQIQRGFYQHPEKAAAPFSPNNAFLKEVKDVIENNLHVYGFDLEQLSRALHLTPSTLHRKLKALMDVSPGDLIRNYRLERARDLLGRKTGKNVADIALEVGFNDASTFTKAFTKKFGCAPSEYAKKHAK